MVQDELIPEPVLPDAMLSHGTGWRPAATRFNAKELTLNPLSVPISLVPGAATRVPCGTGLQRLAMSQMTTYRWTLEDDLNGYRAAGIPAISLWLRKIHEHGAEAACELVRQQPLVVSSLWSAGGFTDQESYSRAPLDEVFETLELAAALGARTLVVVSGPRAGHTQAHWKRIVRSALIDLGDAAAQYQMQIGLLPVSRQASSQLTFLHTNIESTLETLDSCQHPHVGLALDLHSHWEDAALRNPQRLAELAPWLRTIAISDTCNRSCWRDDLDRCLPGEGIMPVAEVLQTLQAAGYRGWHELQLRSEQEWLADDYTPLVARCRESYLQLIATPCPDPSSR